MTMCTSTECPMQKECYRAELDRNDCQEYFNFEYTCNENSGFCDFISVKSNRAEDVCEKTINKSAIQFRECVWCDWCTVRLILRLIVQNKFSSFKAEE